MLNQQHNSGTAEFKITFFFAFFYLAGFRMQVGDLSYHHSSHFHQHKRAELPRL